MRSVVTDSILALFSPLLNTLQVLNDLFIPVAGNRNPGKTGHFFDATRTFVPLVDTRTVSAAVVHSVKMLQPILSILFDLFQLVIKRSSHPVLSVPLRP